MALGYLTYEVTKPPRWNTFLAGLAIDALGVLLIIDLSAYFKNQVRIEPIATAHSVTLIAPAPAELARLTTPRIVPVEPPVVAKLEAPKIAPRPVERAKPPEPPKVAPPKPELPKAAAVAPVAPAGPPKPAPPVVAKTEVFGAAGSETATVHRPPREVQTGGFGDPNGIPGKGDPNRHTVTIASVGSFDLPAGPGKGNGTGGAHGVSGTIRSAGFSDGTASPGPHGRGNGGGVVEGGFGDKTAASAPAARPLQRKPNLQPVEIVFKPRPVYTPEARRLHVQGEVLLDVVFTASGSLRVNRVVKGLGHGLDDAALVAAQHIRFRPALRDGQPYDSAALVHIVFELAD
ncbi:MAG: energy transducer TonB [Terriglobales bacterium]